ncbi:MAG: hypothetical protein HY594_00080, partial [Candidatus Omnitrophica bacterium]|nr:hypothetical protein [Candidatus Omnitrophota bacterium]
MTQRTNFGKNIFRSAVCSILAMTLSLSWKAGPAAAQEASSLQELQASLVEFQESVRRLEEMQRNTRAEVDRLTETLGATESQLSQAESALTQTRMELQSKTG